jgi:hypothetical protein
MTGRSTENAPDAEVVTDAGEPFTRAVTAAPGDAVPAKVASAVATGESFAGDVIAREGTPGEYATDVIAVVD